MDRKQNKDRKRMTILTDKKIKTSKREITKQRMAKKENKQTMG